MCRGGLGGLYKYTAFCLSGSYYYMEFSNKTEFFIYNDYFDLPIAIEEFGP